MNGALRGLTAFATAHRMGRAGLPRDRLLAWQGRQVRRWLARDLPRVAAFDAAPKPLSDLPVMDKATLMANFVAYNRHGITAEAVRAALPDGRLGGLTVGASTGTSGNRGLFVISDTERFAWLGAILAKTMPDLLWRKQRVAVVLPQSTRLYDAARLTGRIDLRFVDIGSGEGHWRDALHRFAPSVIVAPPKVLRALATDWHAPPPLRVFSAAETLDPVDRPPIEARFGRLEQIYMATEGLLAVTCREGRLHLAEDSVHFELEPVGDGLVSPLITNFARRTQIMARYRMNDLLRVSNRPCPCGSPLLAIDEVVGRMDDCFQVAGRMVTPDVLRNAVLGADARIDDFRLRQVADDRVVLTLAPGVPPEVAQVARGAVAARLGEGCHVALEQAEMPLEMGRKLRRVMRETPA